jgi:hypothetical protein
MEKKVIAATAAFLFLYVAPFAFAIPIQIDLGPSGVNFGGRQVSFPAPDVQFQGQSIALDFTFQNAELFGHGRHRRASRHRALPVSPGFGFGNGTSGAIILDGIPTPKIIVGVDPNVPANVVPDTGGTGRLLVIALTALVATQWISRRYRGHFTASESSQS